VVLKIELFSGHSMVSRLEMVQGTIVLMVSPLLSPTMGTECNALGEEACFLFDIEESKGTGIITGIFHKG
jgi:hypothetical protein